MAKMTAIRGDLPFVRDSSLQAAITFVRQNNTVSEECLSWTPEDDTTESTIAGSCESTRALEYDEMRELGRMTTLGEVNG